MGRKEMLQEQAKQQKAQYTLQVQSQLQAQNLLLDQQMNSQLMMLQEAAMAEEEMLVKQFEIQKQYYDAETKLAAQYQKVTADEVKALSALQAQAPGVVV